MTLAFPAGGRLMHTMTTLDVAACLNAAHAADPLRGPGFLDEFEAHARWLGYAMNAKAPCQCPAQPDGGPPVHWPECGLVKTVETADAAV